MATYINEIGGFDKILKLKDGLFILVHVDPEPYGNTHMKSAPQLLTARWQKGIKGIYNYGNTLPNTGDLVIHDSASGIITKRLFHVYEDALLVEFHCEENFD